MKVEAGKVVSLRFVMKNAAGDVIEDIMNQPPVEYLHGSGNILPSLEAGVEGLQAGDAKRFAFKNNGSDDEFQIDLVVDAIRPATAEEIKGGRPEKKAEICGPNCCC
ncbi:FKBP-type peptidyl-prolyl cis-trans isomerase [Mucilaginibacter flavidus]|uniref:FKBP-type peptidyl-prolyl cis-trans isomerase n=1 Tax=Mucilaginibacter flavidus TaxID=2949309 RepID=UPI00209251B3|nr:FKBP-type peptidyl-prolyl cis-trans isomerase [Mucilaginibacter flavidus]MCO5949607.1 FKBP-type peptidyl-prolyl cis-trans isomerase [Mucilaginibacter flavidus]